MGHGKVGNLNNLKGKYAAQMALRTKSVIEK
jgi:hypothetical protein